MCAPSLEHRVRCGGAVSGWPTNTAHAGRHTLSLCPFRGLPQAAALRCPTKRLRVLLLPRVGSPTCGSCRRRSPFLLCSCLHDFRCALTHAASSTPHAPARFLTPCRPMSAMCPQMTSRYGRAGVRRWRAIRCGRRRRRRRRRKLAAVPSPGADALYPLRAVWFIPPTCLAVWIFQEFTGVSPADDSFNPFVRAAKFYCLKHSRTGVAATVQTRDGASADGAEPGADPAGYWIPPGTAGT